MDPITDDINTWRAQKRSKVQVKKEVWIKAGRDQFAKHGLKGINIDDLSKNIGISRTSFYHFFKTKNQFLHEMADYWMEDGTVRIIESTKGIGDPKKRMQMIFDLALHNQINDRFMAQLRYAAVKNVYLKMKMKESEDLRIKALTNLFDDLGYKGKESQEHANLIYYLFLGFLEYHKSEGYSEDDIKKFTKTAISNLL